MEPIKAIEFIEKHSLTGFSEGDFWSSDAVLVAEMAFKEGIEAANLWRDVNSELPEVNKTVLVKYVFGLCNEVYYAVGLWNGTIWDIQSNLPYEVIAWKMI